MTSQTIDQPSLSSTSAYAVVSLIFGILTWVALPLAGALVAIVCGRLAMREISRAAPGEIAGASLAKIGMLLARVQVVLCVCYVAAHMIMQLMFRHH
ncbi:hypothetical protein HDE76_001305 [Rhodanobacter sp. ANJX3]|uniref:DUF4190 domain-containing protein n=1 Tax=unclassified Rhodanobacter TaxID=2621553 RepID=UPI0015C742F9|nr:MULTISPECIES: DUF4190 domain-containing protein [unclassified Rhodanobacter]MBB5358099.1 hypothetical protein [Rhodanobacter sp. ANJX3]NYE29627.1 hypothetical protein [Rhodanobacter sp. K2T2]